MIHPKFTASAIASLAVLLSSSLIVAQITPKDVIQSQKLRPLPSKLDTIPVFNSNSPEGVNALCAFVASCRTGIRSPAFFENAAFKPPLGSVRVDLSPGLHATAGTNYRDVGVNLNLK